MMLGGMIGPIIAAHASTAAANSGRYPSRFMAGIIIEPIAARSARPDPESADMNMLATMLACARPPRRCPTSARERPTRRSVIPATFMSSPARTKSGTASSGKLSSAS